jgi:hypothetical protein
LAEFFSKIHFIAESAVGARNGATTPVTLLPDDSRRAKKTLLYHYKEDTVMVKAGKRRGLPAAVLAAAIACAMVVLVSGTAFSGTNTKGDSPVSAENETSIILSVMGYGFKVKVLVNGKDSGIKGGKSEGKRLFFTDSRQLDEMPPDMRPQFQLLGRGENTFAIDFEKIPGSQGSGLEITVALDSNPDEPLFTITDGGKSSGKVEKKVTIR